MQEWKEEGTRPSRMRSWFALVTLHSDSLHDIDLEFNRITKSCS